MKPHQDRHHTDRQVWISASAFQQLKSKAKLERRTLKATLTFILENNLKKFGQIIDKIKNSNV